jgi:hypothetical protein
MKVELDELLYTETAVAGRTEIWGFVYEWRYHSI